MNAIVDVRDLRKTHGRGPLAAQALRGVTFSVGAGTLTAITGPSGCGKSTLLSVLAGLDAADSGYANVGGVNLTAASARELTLYRRRQVGVVFQAYNLLPSLTAAENVEAGLEFLSLSIAEKQRRAREALSWVDLDRLADRFPAQLSGGQQQRVAIARAIAREPALLLADEPTGNLDRDASARILEVLWNLTRHLGCTCIMVTHDLELAGACDRTIRLSDGAVVLAADESGVRHRHRSGVALQAAAEQAWARAGHR